MSVTSNFSRRIGRPNAPGRRKRLPDRPKNNSGRYFKDPLVMSFREYTFNASRNFSQT